MTRPIFTPTYHHAPYPAITNAVATGKNVVITGGGKGIGKAIAFAFARAGAKGISIIARGEKQLEETAKELARKHSKVTIDYQVVDILDFDSVKAALERSATLHGSLDILINNAGYLSDQLPVATSPLPDWWSGFEVNVKGTLHATQAFLAVAHSPEATVITINSLASHVSSNVTKNYSSYCGSKLAAVNMMEHLQVEEPSLRVFSIQPGIIASDMQARAKGFTAEDEIELPGAFCVWLSNPEADFLKGRFVWANWDVEELKARAAEIVEKDLLTVRLSGWPTEGSF
ncbi:uncharacterized protein K452DRAFT_231027 [Aplosporella prunicola CBS 121167]|uniref:Uncharacterized protein n=1 Tax=Aplosporella prunicola CBS 121167 TaxID=1176127 RepID=A0A6A6B817_9PEZI|nr:uncharacterized protein K452DRAFT_231027 [Aplosporella prunicola CBS 121167]KAF2140289.1 hypothetical protein K452DRAFT_231027 [Aplosporella prunicola CBS 121167]